MVGKPAGKDRTGVFAALLLTLAGAERQVIAYDYELTRIGIEPRREELARMLLAWNEEWAMESPGMTEFTQVKGEFILDFLDAVEEKYGGVEAYTRDELGFSAEDVGRIKRVLTGEKGGGMNLFGLGNIQGPVGWSMPVSSGMTISDDVQDELLVI